MKQAYKRLAIILAAKAIILGVLAAPYLLNKNAHEANLSQGHGVPSQFRANDANFCGTDAQCEAKFGY